MLFLSILLQAPCQKASSTLEMLLVTRALQQEGRQCRGPVLAVIAE
jgi:hypothetical protein